MRKNIIKVNCSFCGKEIECPEHMAKKVEKHLCFECFNSEDKISTLGREEEFKKKVLSGKIHIDIPLCKLKDKLPEVLAEKLTEEVFSMIWEKLKKDVGEYNKKELAEKMFYQGAIQAFANSEINLEPLEELE
jgi:hypothetical protein